MIYHVICIIDYLRHLHPVMLGYRGSSFNFVQMAFEDLFEIPLKNAQIEGELNYIIEINIYLNIL